ncbi:MAG: hypothetical protein ACRCXK_08935, partial [Wohlfahrtiimonas sp.]
SFLSHLARACFYACSQDTEKAIKYFKSAFMLSSENSLCLNMYIDYLIMNGRVINAFNLISENKSVLQRDQFSATSLQFLSYPLLAKCDIGGINELIENACIAIEKYKNTSEELQQFLYLLSVKANDALMFKNKLEFDDEQFDALCNIYIDIANKNNFEGLRIIYDCDEDYDLYSIMLYTTNQSVEKICDANFELVERIAKNNIFGNSRFSIMFEHLDIDIHSHMVGGV